MNNVHITFWYVICNLPLQIGTWSRWLEDQFEQKEGKSDDSNNKEKPECENFRLFHLLNSLGDLMMLPFKMLADESTRREVSSYTTHISFLLVPKTLFD